MEPRPLRILVIDDRADHFKEADFVAGQRLESVSYTHDGATCFQISSLSTLCSYWQTAQAGNYPDIIISDIKFDEDTSSPLQAASRPGVNADIPTGLSHAKAFAAVSRATAKPMSIHIYSQDPGFWQARANQENDIVAKVFSLIAAQEIAELSALLGQRLQNFSNMNITPAWEWIENNVSRAATEARAKALAGFRQSFICGVRQQCEPGGSAAAVQIRIPHKHASLLREWCERMKAEPKPITPGRNDPGIKFVAENDELDCIEISSFFADVRRIASREQRAECFDTKPVSDGDVWNLSNGEPRIGALIAEFYDSTKDFRDAIFCLKQLPLKVETLSMKLTDIEVSKFAKGLAILFRDIEIEHAKSLYWASCWTQKPWNPILQQPADLDTSPDAYMNFPTLGGWVQIIAKLAYDAREGIQPEDDDDHWIEDVLESVNGKLSRDLKITKESLFWHLNIIDDQYEFWAKQDPTSLDKIPSMPPSFTWPCSEANKLEDSLGFGKKGPVVARQRNYNSVGRLIFDAFGRGELSGDAKAGRELLTQFRDGQMPSNLKSYCREYCLEELGWIDQRQWPFSLAE